MRKKKKKRETAKKLRNTHTGRQNEREEVKRGCLIDSQYACLFPVTHMIADPTPPPDQALWADRPRTAAPF